MKKLLLVGCLLLATSSMSFATTNVNSQNVQQKYQRQKQQTQIRTQNRIQTQKPPVKGENLQKAGMQNVPKRANLDQRLNLTDAQKASAEKIRKQGHKQMKPIMDKLISKKEQKRLLMQNKNPGVKEIQKLDSLNKEITSLKNQAEKIRKKNNQQFEAILTETQRKEFNEIKKEGRQNFKKRHNHAKPFMNSEFDKNEKPSLPPYEICPKK